MAHFLEQSEQESQAVLNDLVKQAVLLEVMEQGRSENLPTLLKVSSHKQTREVQMDGVRQQLVLPLPKWVNGKKVSKKRADEPDQIEVEVQLAIAASREK